jgi:hypothetical protein
MCKKIALLRSMESFEGHTSLNVKIITGCAIRSF